MIERPTLHALALFAAVVEHGTMTAAASAAAFSQPAISAQVQALERYYGTPLLARAGRGVAPTEADVLALIANGVPEDLTLDFKARGRSARTSPPSRIPPAVAGSVVRLRRAAARG